MSNGFTYLFYWEEDMAIGDGMFLRLKIWCSCGNVIEIYHPSGDIVCTACHEEYTIYAEALPHFYYAINAPDSTRCRYTNLCNWATSPIELIPTCSRWDCDHCKIGYTNDPPPPQGIVERSE